MRFNIEVHDNLSAFIHFLGFNVVDSNIDRNRLSPILTRNHIYPFKIRALSLASHSWRIIPGKLQITLSPHDPSSGVIPCGLKPLTHQFLQGGAPVRNRDWLVQISPMSLWFCLVIYRTSQWDYNPFITWGVPPCSI